MNFTTGQLWFCFKELPLSIIHPQNASQSSFLLRLMLDFEV